MSKEDRTPAAVQQKSPQIVLLAVNPKSGGKHRRDLIDEAMQLIGNKGFKATVETSIEEICQAVTAFSAAGELRAVVSAGGDGTLALLANRLPNETPLCVFPLGTENLVARSLGYEKTPAGLVQVLSNGKEIRWDVGLANGRAFLAMLGAGFDAEVVARAHAERRGHISYASYISPILRAATAYSYPPLMVTCWTSDEAEPVQFETRWAFVANLARYALGLSICPAANTQDSLLDGVFLGRSGFLSGLRYLWKIRMGNHLRDPSVKALQGVRFRIESDRPTPYQIDGDPGGMLPVDISILPGRLRLLVPAAARDVRVEAAAGVSPG